MKRFILQVFYVVFSGVMLSFSISNELLHFGSPVLALFSLYPMYMAFYKSKSYRESFFLFFFHALIVHLISSSWLANFHGFGIFTLGASALGTAVEGGCCGVVIYSYPYLLQQKKNLNSNYESRYSIFKRILWFALCYTLWEYMKSVEALGYPWGTVSMGAYSWKILTQIADITSVYGITFIYALFSAFVGECLLVLEEKQTQKFTAIKSDVKQAFKFVFIVFAVVFLYGCFRYFTLPAPKKNMNIVLVQQNIDSWNSSETNNIEISKILSEEKIDEFNEKGKNCDLVLWSEGVLNHSFPGSRNYYNKYPSSESLSKFIKRIEIPFIIGGMTISNHDKNTHANSAVLFDSEGKYSGFSSKIHLVPFAERIPYYDNPLMQKFMKNVVGMYSDLVPGFQYTLFKLPLSESKYKVTPLDYNQNPFALIELNKSGESNSETTELYIKNKQENPNAFVKVGVPICFEDSFPIVDRALFNLGAELLLNITNDSWSNTKSAEYQHFIAASYRTIELRTTMVRCANSGYSVVINPRGEIIDDLPLFQEAAGAFTVPVYEHKATVYSRFGDWFVYLLMIFFFVYIAYVIYDLYIKNLKLPDLHFKLTVENTTSRQIYLLTRILETAEEMNKTLLTANEDLQKKSDLLEEKIKKIKAENKTPKNETEKAKAVKQKPQTEKTKTSRPKTETAKVKATKANSVKAKTEKVKAEKSGTKKTVSKTKAVSRKKDSK